MERIKVVVERHAEGYVAYPLGLKGIVVGQGESPDEALADVTSAIRFHLETFDEEALDLDSPVRDAFVTQAAVTAPKRRRWSGPAKRGR
jgi:predicted RNase H-like HicB family nuclease